MQGADATAVWDKLVGGKAQSEGGAIIVYPQSLGDPSKRQVGDRRAGLRSAWRQQQCLGGSQQARPAAADPHLPLGV